MAASRRCGLAVILAQTKERVFTDQNQLVRIDLQLHGLSPCLNHSPSAVSSWLTPNCIESLSSHHREPLDNRHFRLGIVRNQLDSVSFRGAGPAVNWSPVNLPA